MCPKETGAGAMSAQEAERAREEIQKEAMARPADPGQGALQEMKINITTGAVRTYKVKPGDTLSKIAKEIYGDAGRWKEVYEANKLLIGDNPNLIKVGTTIRIP